MGSQQSNDIVAKYDKISDEDMAEKQVINRQDGHTIQIMVKTKRGDKVEYVPYDMAPTRTCQHRPKPKRTPGL